MAVINDPNTAGNIIAVGEKSTSSTGAGHVILKPIPASIGHYRYSVRISSTTAQAANSRIFEIRNTSATNLIIPTRLIVTAMQTAAGTGQENSLDIFKCTGFTAVDTTNTVTPVPTSKRTSMSATTAAIRHLTITGVAAGMTGGTLVKDANPIATFPFLVNTAAPTTPNAYWGPFDVLAAVGGDYPLVFVQNEGLEIENRVLNVTSYGFTWFIDFSFAEVAAY